MKKSKAIKIIRDKYPEETIVYCFEYEERFVLLLSPLKDYSQSDLNVCHVSVDKKSGEIRPFNLLKESIEHTDLMDAMRQTISAVDIESDKLKIMF